MSRYRSEGETQVLDIVVYSGDVSARVRTAPDRIRTPPARLDSGQRRLYFKNGGKGFWGVHSDEVFTSLSAEDADTQAVVFKIPEAIRSSIPRKRGEPVLVLRVLKQNRLVIEAFGRGYGNAL